MKIYRRHWKIQRRASGIKLNFRHLPRGRYRRRRDSQSFRKRTDLKPQTLRQQVYQIVHDTIKPATQPAQSKWVSLPGPASIWEDVTNGEWDAIDTILETAKEDTSTGKRIIDLLFKASGTDGAGALISPQLLELIGPEIFGSQMDEVDLYGESLAFKPEKRAEDPITSFREALKVLKDRK